MANRSGDSEADLLRRYVHEVEAHPRLTPEEQADFVAHASTDHTGAHEARRRLIQSHLRVVVEIAHRLEHRGVPLLDLIQEGNLGLMRAVDRLEEGISVDFDAAVRWHVRQAMGRVLHDAGAEFDRELDAAYGSFESPDATTDYPPYDPGFPTGSASSPDHGGETCPSPGSNVRALRALPGGGSATRSGRELSGETAPYDLVADQLEREALELQLDWLSPREQMVLRLRFGLDETGELTMQRIAQEFDVTTEHVRQIEKKAMSKLRHPSVARLWSADQIQDLDQRPTGS